MRIIHHDSLKNKPIINNSIFTFDKNFHVLFRLPKKATVNCSICGKFTRAFNILFPRCWDNFCANCQKDSDKRALFWKKNPKGKYPVEE